MNAIENLCDEFERDYQLGNPPKIETLLDKVPESQQEELLRELIAIEVHYRRLLGELPTFEMYSKRFQRYDLTAVAKEFSRGKLSPECQTIPMKRDWEKRESADSKIPPTMRYVGDYEILAEIARGGMGTVYRARQISLERLVALKMISSGRFASTEEVERFRQEAAAAAKLDHPGIVPIFEIGVFEGRHFFTMGLVNGESLDKRITSGPLDFRDAAKLVQIVCGAVQCAHENGIVHRDLKPANILLDKQGKPRVSDFGLAKSLVKNGNLTEIGQVLGTPGFMPPEQALSRLDLIGHASDIYSLGAILYNAVTGRPPFQSASLTETLRQVVENNPVSPRTLNPSVPKDLETIILRCLEKNPSRRYLSASDLASELERLLEGRPILARPISRLKHFFRWCKREPILAMTSMCSIALLTAVSVTSTLSYMRESNLLSKITVEQSTTKKAKKLADEELYRSLVRSAEALRLSQREGWKKESLENLMRAAKLDVPERDLVALRSEAAMCLAGFDVCRVVTHPASANSMAVDVHPTEPLLASWSPEQGVSVWKWEEDQLSHLSNGPSLQFEKHDAEIPQDTNRVFPAGFRQGVRFHPTGNFLAFSDNLDSVRFWSADSDRDLPATIRGSSTADHIEFDAHGKLIAIGWRGGQVGVYEVETGKRIYWVPSGDRSQWLSQHNPIAFSQDGTRLAVPGFDNSIEIHSIRASQVESRIELEKSEIRNVNALTISPSGRLLAAVLATGQIRVWSVDTAANWSKIEIGLNGLLGLCLRFSPDESLLAVGIAKNSDESQTADSLWQEVLLESRGVHIYETATGDLLGKLRGKTSKFGSGLAFSRDNQNLFVVDDEMTILSISKSTYLRRLGNSRSGWQGSIAFHPKKAILASAKIGKPIEIWDLNQGDIVRQLSVETNRFMWLDFSADGEYLCGWSNTGGTTKDRSFPAAFLWKSETGERLRSFFSESDEYYYDVSMSPDHKHLLLWQPSRSSATCWDVQSGAVANHWLVPEKSEFRVKNLWLDQAHVLSAWNEQAASCLEIRETGKGEVKRKVEIPLHSDSDATISIHPLGSQELILSQAWREGTLRVLDRMSLKEKRTGAVHLNSNLAGLATSDDGQWIAVLDEKDRIVLLDGASLEPVIALSQDINNLSDLALSANGELLAVADSNRRQVWFLSELRQKLEGTPLAFPPIKSPTVIPLSKLSKAERDIYRYADQGEFAAADRWTDNAASPSAKAPTFGNNAPVFMNRNWIASTANHRPQFWNQTSDDPTNESTQKTPEVWSLSSTKDSLSFEAANEDLHEVIVSNDGKFVAGSTERSIVHLWDGSSGKVVGTLVTNNGKCTSMRFSPNGERLLTANSDNEMQVWDTSSKQEVHRLDVDQKIDQVRVSESAEQIAVCSGGIVRRWKFGDYAELPSLFGHAGIVSDVAWSPNDQWVLTSASDRTVRLWDSETGKLLHTLPNHGRKEVTAIAWTRDSRCFASGCSDGNIRIWHRDDLEHRMVLTGHKGPVKSISFSSDGSSLFSIGADRMVRSWDVSEFTSRLISTDLGPSLVSSRNVELPRSNERVQVLRCVDLHISSTSLGLKTERQDLSIEFGNNWQVPVHLLAFGRRPGDFLEMKIDTPNAQRNRLTLLATQSFDFGELQFSVNGIEVPRTFDAYDPSVVSSPLLELGEFESKEGELRLQVEVVGANPRSERARYLFGLAAIIIEKADGRSNSDVRP